MSLERPNPIIERAIDAARNEFEDDLRKLRERSARTAFGTIQAAIKLESRWVADACPRCGNSNLAKYRVSLPNSGLELKCNSCGWSEVTPHPGPHIRNFGHSSNLKNAFRENFRQWVDSIMNSDSFRIFVETVGRSGRANGCDEGWVSAQIDMLRPVWIDEFQQWITGACEGPTAPTTVNEWKAPIWLRNFSAPEELVPEIDLRTRRLGSEEAAHVCDELLTQIHQSFDFLKKLGVDRALIQMAQISQPSETISKSLELGLPDNLSKASGKLTRLGNNIDRLRKEYGWSFDLLAQKMGIDKKLILSHVNKGAKPRPQTLKMYAQAFSKELGRTISVSELEN